MINEQARPRNIFILVRLIALIIIAPILVFVWVYKIGGYSFELGIGLAAIVLAILGFIFWKFLLPKV